MHNMDGGEIVMEAEISFVPAKLSTFLDYPVLLDHAGFIPLQRFSY